MSSYTILYYTILYYTILYYNVIYCTILYYTIPYYTVLYCTMLYYAMLWYTVMPPWTRTATTATAAATPRVAFDSHVVCCCLSFYRCSCFCLRPRLAYNLLWYGVTLLSGPIAASSGMLRMIVCCVVHTCHNLPPSEIDLGLLRADSTDLEGKHLFHI